MDVRQRGVASYGQIILLLIGVFGCFAYEFFLMRAGLLRGIAVIVIALAILCLVIRDGRWRKTRKMPMVVFSLVASLCCVWGACLDIYNDLWMSFPLLVLFIMLAVAIFPIACFFSAWLDQCQKPNNADENGRDSHAVLRARPDWRLFYLCSAFIAAAWILCYLVLYPGVYGYDGPFMLREHMDASTAVVSKYSVLYSWVYAHLIMFGHDALGTYEAGFALFSAVQMAFVYVCVLLVLRRIVMRHESRWATIAAACFFAFNPVFSILSVSSSQDAVFMALFSVIIAEVVAAADSPQTFRGLTGRSIFLGFVVVLFCLARNNGVYALLFPLIFFWFAQKEVRKTLSATIAISLVIALSIQGPAYNALGVAGGTALREMSSIPVMQLCRAYLSDADLRENDDGAQIVAYIPKENLEYYEINPEISDIMKRGLNVEKVVSDPAAFVGLYLRVGLSHIGSYTEAFAMNTLGLWFPFKSYPDDRMYHPWIETEVVAAQLVDPSNVEIKSESIIPFLHIVVNKYLGGAQEWGGTWNEAFAGLPFGTVFVKFGFYFWTIVYLSIYFVSRNRRPDFYVAVYFWGILITVLLAPVALCRYVAPLMMAIPMLLSCAAKAAGKR